MGANPYFVCWLSPTALLTYVSPLHCVEHAGLICAPTCPTSASPDSARHHSVHHCCELVCVSLCASLHNGQIPLELLQPRPVLLQMGRCGMQSGLPPTASCAVSIAAASAAALCRLRRLLDFAAPSAAQASRLAPALEPISKRSMSDTQPIGVSPRELNARPVARTIGLPVGCSST